MKITFVIPCYHSEKTIENVVCRVIKVMEDQFTNHEYEIVLVNDGSKDKTADTISSLALQNSTIMAINLAKNVGQHGAIMAGFNNADGDIIVTLDDDGQTPIENLHLMIDKISEGYDVVSAKYTVRHHTSLFRKVGTFLNRKMSQWLIERPDGISLSVFLVIRKFVVDEIIKYKQPFPYLSGLILRITHNICNIEMEQAERAIGESGYSLKKLLGLWLNGFTAFSIKPLRVATICGLLSSGLGIIFAIITILRKLFFDNIQVGWSSVVVILLIIGGLILFVLGIMGEYIGRIYMCINNTPQYVIHDSIKTDHFKNEPMKPSGD